MGSSDIPLRGALPAELNGNRIENT